MLSEWQMQRFIDQNDLYSRFGITTAEVAKDAATILNQRPKISGTKQPPVYDLPEYKMALTKELLPIAQNGLSDHEIAQFIKSKPFLKLTHEFFGKNHIADTQGWRNRLGEGIKVNDVIFDEIERMKKEK